ncbi:hypothetical protein [Parvularcula maris]|uniref:Uncharacterized protein n=1 Tax=Parvularcula maris TaxID=2965077 RepID=A0A9X2L9L0_9PROT|nr:hypothetical protein [Parvularcula maris]MCQ8185631.1 hypothetical protein [Parvularcula maris]
MSEPEGACGMGPSERSRKLVEPALEHLVRLEAYFRLNGLAELAEKTEAVLAEAERLMRRDAAGDPAETRRAEVETLEEETPAFVTSPSKKAYG